MIHKTIHVNAKNNSYPIYVGETIYSQKSILLQHIQGHQVCIVAQENCAQYYLQALQHSLSHLRCDVILLPDGESAKNLHEWQKIMDFLLKNHYERSSTLIALGGGVVGDITGFAAACYQRGINYIQIPTTLMAQVDSSIGGKTGVNHSLGKNMIGAFHQPQCVIADVSVLATLSERELHSGLAEVVKYGLLAEANFFLWLENNIQALLDKNKSALLHAVSNSAAIKATIVSQDEKDQGLRNLLNLGHTFGHALETFYSYQNMLHGEAVAWGILMAAQLSVELDYISGSDLERIRQVLKKCKLLAPITSSTAELFELMKRDKKVKQGKLTLILLKQLGEAITVSGISEEKIISAIDKTLLSRDR